jgi:hypothetical protein
MSNKPSVVFPKFNRDGDYEPTQPLSLDELPRQVRIDRSMAVITAHHERIAKAIKLFWGHKECVDLLRQLILDGGDGFGKARVGFKLEVLSALITLAAVHELE